MNSCGLGVQHTGQLINTRQTIRVRAPLEVLGRFFAEVIQAQPDSEGQIKTRSIITEVNKRLQSACFLAGPVHHRC
jgi:hypothetical protein